MLARFGRSILLYYECGRNTLANSARAGHTSTPFTALLRHHLRHPVTFTEFPCPGRRTQCRPLRRRTDGYSGACVKRLSFYTVTTPGVSPTCPEHPTPPSLGHTHTHTHRRCPAFIGLKCENCK